MSPDLLTQLAAYGTYCEERQGSVLADEVIGDVARLPEPTPTRSIGSGRRWLVAVGAAALTLLLVGGVAWIARSNPPGEPADEPAVTTVPPDEQLGTLGVLGPGGWSVAATFTDGTISEELLSGTVEELRSWPGVLEVAIARDASGWLELTGLDAAVCGDGSTEPPCGVGLVALVATPQMVLTQVRLESELEMVAIKATDVPVAFLDGYVAAARRQPAADLRFDVLPLGTEVPLEGPDGADSGNLCSVADCLVSVRVSDDGLVAQAGLVRHENGDGSFEVEVLGESSHGGRGFGTTDFLIDGSGRGGVLAIDAAAGDRAVYGLAGLPLDAAAVTLQLADGTSVWQRPVGGMVLLVDRPGTAVGESAWPPYRFTVLDADGGEIIHIENTPDGPTVTDLRVDPVKATTTTPEALPTTTISLDSVQFPRVTDVIETGGWPWPPLVATQDAVWITGSNETVTRIDASTRQVTDTIPVGESPLALLTTAEAVWVVTGGEGTVVRIDLATREVTDTIRVGGQATSPLIAEGALWVQSEGKGLVRVDLESRQVTDEYQVLDGQGWWAEVIEGAIWSFNPSGDFTLSRFDLTDRDFTTASGRLPTATTEECCLAVEDAIWLVDHEGSVKRVDLSTLQVTDRLNLGRGLTRGIVAAGAIWLPHSTDGVVYRISPELREVTDIIRVGSDPWQPAFADGAIWVPNQGDGTVSRIDIESRQVTHTIQVGNRPLTPLAFDGAIWVPNLEDGTVTRIQTR